jgi:hypothetical protein
MSELVPFDEIEALVGVQRHSTLHIARASSVERRVYLLHSKACVDTGIDLRECKYSLALDRGIDPVFDMWLETVPMVVGVSSERHGQRLVPLSIAGVSDT